MSVLGRTAGGDRATKEDVKKRRIILKDHVHLSSHKRGGESDRGLRHLNGGGADEWRNEIFVKLDWVSDDAGESTVLAGNDSAAAGNLLQKNGGGGDVLGTMKSYVEREANVLKGGARHDLDLRILPETVGEVGEIGNDLRVLVKNSGGEVLMSYVFHGA
jgi:hypothetical protein